MGTMWHTKLLPTSAPSTSKQRSDVAMVTYTGKVVDDQPRAPLPVAGIVGGGLMGGTDRFPPCPPPPPPPLTTRRGLQGSSDHVVPYRGSPHPALRSMHNGMTTTVPQNLTSPDVNGYHLTHHHFPHHQHRVGRVVLSGGGGGGGGGVRRSRIRQLSVQSQRENLAMKCCRINVLLVIMQLALGGVVTALGFYMQTLTPSMQVRECPYWAGIPVSDHFFLPFVGTVSVYYAGVYIQCCVHSYLSSKHVHIYSGDQRQKKETCIDIMSVA